MKSSVRKWHLSIGCARGLSENLGGFWSGPDRIGLPLNTWFCGLVGATLRRSRKGETGNGGNPSRCPIPCAGICLLGQRRLERLAQEIPEGRRSTLASELCQCDGHFVPLVPRETLLLVASMGHTCVPRGTFAMHRRND